MSVSKRKVCMVGATGVGKTSLVARYVRQLFSDTYLTTVGVTIDKARVSCRGREVELVLWDLSGEDEFQSVQRSYLRGAAGYVLVADAMRPASIDMALALRQSAMEVVGAAPSLFALNKVDLLPLGPLDLDKLGLAELGAAGVPVVATSAKSGVGVAAAFSALVERILDGELAEQASP